MEFTSTRSNLSYESSQVIVQGISQEGGLFVPKSFPKLSEKMIRDLLPMSYSQRAESILSLYLTDFSKEEISHCVEMAYSGTFENDMPAPLVELDNNVHILELWHGPTCAFKDMALQLLPHLLVTATKKRKLNKKTVILVATSGDTGKAALDGF